MTFLAAWPSENLANSGEASAAASIAALSAPAGTRMAPRILPLICSTSSISSCANAASSTAGQGASSRSATAPAKPSDDHSAWLMCGQAGYSARSKIDVPSHNTAASPALASGLKPSSAFSSFMQPDTTVLYCMRS